MINDKLSLFRDLRLLDICFFTYLVLISLVVLWFNTQIEGWYFYLLAHIATVAMALVFVKFANGSESRAICFFRDVYPMLLFTFTFKEVSLIISELPPFWFETYLLSWDKWLVGGYPTVLVQNLYRPWLTELMAFSYWSYYIIFPLTASIYVVRKDWKVLQSFAFQVGLCMYACYVQYLFLPARGPKQTLAHLHLTREAVGFFDNMIMDIQSAASITGNAFPSSHVAAVWIVLFFLFRHRKWLGWSTLPLILALTVSTVYLQYHYIADAVVGVLLAFVTYPIGRDLERRYENWQCEV